jgi:hypothetical protein
MAVESLQTSSNLTTAAPTPASDRRQSLLFVAGALVAWFCIGFLPFDGLVRRLPAAATVTILAGVALLTLRKATRARPGALSWLSVSLAALAVWRTGLVQRADAAETRKLAAFLLFLLLYGIFLAGVCRLVSVDLTDRRTWRAYSFWRSEAVGLMDLAFVMAALFLLARFFEPRLILLLAAASGASNVVTLIAHRALGASGRADRQVGWLSSELGVSHPWFVSPTVLPILLVVFAYPAVMGVIYLTHPVPSDAVTLWTFRMTIFATYIVGLPLVIVNRWCILASPYLDESTRMRDLIAGLGTVFQFGLMSALVLSTFEPGSAEKPNASAYPVAIALGYSFIVFVLPYFLGSARARRREMAFLRERKAAILHLIEALEYPTDEESDRLMVAVHAELAAAEHRLRIENPLLAAVMARDEIPADVRERLPMGAQMGLPKATREAFDAMLEQDLDQASASDPRVSHLAELRRAKERIAEIAETVPLDDQDVLRPKWIRFLRSRVADLDVELRERPRNRVPAWLSVGGLVAPIMSVLLGQLGTWLWIEMARSLSA